jgi:hypothetical protein
MKRLNAIILALCFGGSAVLAQQQQEHSFFQAGSAFDDGRHKEVLIAITDLDPYAAVSVSDDMMVLQVRSTQLTEAQIRDAITSTGIDLLPGTPDLQALYGTAPDVPMYVPTGEPAADHKRYVDAVNAWNAANPDRPMPEPIPLDTR